MAKKKAKGAGSWVAQAMDIERPGQPSEMIEAIGIYNTVTKQFKLVELPGEELEEYCEENEDQDADELMALHEQEAENWARLHNADGI